MRLLSAARACVAHIAEDYRAVLTYRGKYNGETGTMSHLPVDAVQRVGVQMMVAVRLMRLCRDSGLPLAHKVAARAIRHLYAADIHWNAELAPGVSIIHGQGLVVSGAARVGRGCILFQNVTLGEGRDPATHAVGSPTLEEDVHVGPGAVLLGPITVGAGSKIMAGCVLTQSVPRGSLVEPGAPRVTPRQAKPTGTRAGRQPNKRTPS